MNKILPKAKRLTDGYDIKKENQNLNPFASVYRFITEGPLILITTAIALLSLFIALILADKEEKVSDAASLIVVIMMGLTFMLAAVNKKVETNGTGSAASVRRAFLIIGFLMVFFSLVDYFGSGDDSVNKVLPVVLVLLDAYWILNGMILPWIRYFLIKKRMRRCTEGAVAKLTNMESGSLCTGELKNEEMSAYEYVYEFFGSKYLINTYEKYTFIERFGNDLIVDIDPEEPEYYYSPDLIYTRSLGSTLIDCLTNTVFIIVMIFITVMLMYR